MTSDSSPVQAEPGPDGADSTTGTGIDTTVPHSARIWNYWLGGTDNYAVDREAGEAYKAIFPGIAVVARTSRGFLTRAVRYLAGEAGMRQFLDIGTGLPPRTTPTRWPSPSRRRRGSSTWTTIPWCWRTPGPC